MSPSSLKHRIYYLIILTIIERSESLLSLISWRDGLGIPSSSSSISSPLSIAFWYPYPTDKRDKKNRRKWNRRIIVLYRIVLRFINLTSSGHLYPLLSWRCLSLQLLAKWGYQAHLNLSLLCEWNRYDPCWYLFLLCSSHSARKSLWDSFHSSSFHSCCEWLAVIISAYEYRNRIVIAIRFKDASICISLLWSNSFLRVMSPLPNNLEELLKCIHTIETFGFRIGQEVYVHCSITVDDAQWLSSWLHV